MIYQILLMTELSKKYHFLRNHNILFPKKNVPYWKELKNHLIKEGSLSKSDIIEIINFYRDIVKN